MWIVATIALAVIFGSSVSDAIVKTETLLPDSPTQTAAKLIERLEEMERSGEPRIRRVYRRDDGTIRMLRCHELELTEREFYSITTIRRLEVLDFSKSNIRNHHLAYYSQLPGLVNIRLHLTKITDAGVNHFIDYPALRSICLGKVDVSYEAWAKMKSLHQEKYHRERPLAGGLGRGRNERISGRTGACSRSRSGSWSPPSLHHRPSGSHAARTSQ